MEKAKWNGYNCLAFALLSPLCQKLMKNPTEDVALKLKSLINDIPSDSLQVFQRYLFMPLCFRLRKDDLRLNVKVHIVDCLSSIIHKTKVVECDLFTKIFSDIFILISDKSFQNIVPNIPEELKLSVVKCATVLISNSSPEVLEAFYCEKHLHLVCHGIYFCLALAKEERFVDLRIAALECLLHVCQVHGEKYPFEVKTHINIGHVLMVCFPGITLGLKKVICADAKQNHKITMMAIRAWSRITAQVMENGVTEAEDVDDAHWVNSKNDLINFLDKKECFNSDSREYILSILRDKKRTKEWCSYASRSIYPVVVEICLLYFSNWNVRMEMVLAAELLLTCTRNIKECVPSLVGVLLILSEDETVAVSEKSKIALETLSKNFDKKHSLALIEVLENHFLKVAHKLSFSSPGEEDLKTSLNLMCGYLKLLGRHAHQITRSYIHMNALLSAIIKTVTLDYLTISPVEDWNLGTSGLDILKANAPWKCFKYFKDKSIFSKFKDICLIIGQHSDLTMLSDYLLQRFYEDTKYQREIILVTNEIFSGVSSSQNEIVFPIMKGIIKSYLKPEMWQMEQTDGTETKVAAKKHTVADIRSRIVKACLLVEGLGMFSRVTTSVQASREAALDSWYFRVCLYPILERIGQPNPVLAGAGKLALAHISHVTGIAISEVIHSNSDYVIRHVVLKLRNASGYCSPEPLHVLMSVLEFSSPNILEQLEEAVESVVNYGFKYANDRRSSNSLKCLLVFTKFVNIKFPKSRNLNMKMVDKIDNLTTGEILSEKEMGQVTQKILNYKRLRETADSTCVECEYDFEKENEQYKEHGDLADGSLYIKGVDMVEDETCETRPPKHVMLTVQVLQQILAFISSKDKERKLMALEILTEGIQIAEGYQNELLPLVHKIWSPLSAQFANEDPLVVHRAFNLLMVLAVVSKNFIRERTLRKVLPEISKFLIAQAKISRKKDSASAYRFTQAYKLQCSLLDGLGDLAVNLEFQEQDLSEMLTATAPYLSALQPQPLQNACIKAYKLASALDHNIMFLKLAHLENLFQDMKPPSQEFKIPQVPRHTNFSMECSKNVSLLKSYLLNNA